MSERPDIVVRCREGHVMQRFRWMSSQGVWHPSRSQDEVVPVYPGGEVGTTPDGNGEWPLPDHWKWPMTCNSCIPRQTRTFRDDRMSAALTLLWANGQTDVPVTIVDGVLARLWRRV